MEQITLPSRKESPRLVRMGGQNRTVASSWRGQAVVELLPGGIGCSPIEYDWPVQSGNAVLKRLRRGQSCWDPPYLRRCSTGICAAVPPRIVAECRLRRSARNTHHPPPNMIGLVRKNGLTTDACPAESPSHGRASGAGILERKIALGSVPA